MSEDNKTSTGAPSSDTTSALFVSARKKQLEQQEAERHAKEKEAERMKAEAEVHRLETEVAERKRRAEEEALHVTQEEEQRRIESEKRQRSESMTLQKVPQSVPVAGGQNNNIPVKRKNRWVPLIIGGIVALFWIAVFFLISLGGSDEKPEEKDQTDTANYASLLLDAEGSWYLDGNMNSTRLDTDGNGNWDCYDSDGTLLGFGYFTVEDDGTILAVIPSDTSEADSEPVVFIDSESFRIIDEVYYSAAFSTNGGQDDEESEDNSLVLDPNAEMNDNAVIDSIGMMVRFPDTIFQVDSLTESLIILASLDGNATIEVSKGESCDANTEENMTKYRDKKLEKMLAALPSDTALLDSGYYVNDSNVPFIYYNLSYTGENEIRYVYFISAVWTNERTGTGSFSDFVLDCPEELTDDYTTLFNRIHNTRDDA